MEAIDAKFWLTFCWDIITAIGILYVWMTGRRKATSESITDLAKVFFDEQKKNENRLVKLEEARLNAIRHDDLKELYTRMGGIEKGLSKLEGRFESVDHLNQSIQEIGLRSK